MYIKRVPNRNSPPALLLRESYREGDRVKKRTLANLSSLPEDVKERDVTWENTDIIEIKRKGKYK